MKTLSKNARSLLLISFQLINFFLHAQETFDLISYKPPAGWKKQEKEGLIAYTNIDAQKGAYCMISLYKSESSAGNLKADFEKEWKDLVADPFKVSNAPSTEKNSSTNGWEAMSGAASFKSGEQDASVLLTTLTGHERRTSIVIILSHADYMSDIEAFLGSVQMKTPEKNAPEKKTDATTPTIAGSWGKVYSPLGAYSNDLPVNLAFSGTKRGEYVLNTNGTYRFHGENWGGQVKNNDNQNKMRLKNENEYGLIDEIGTFQVNGNKLTLIPSKNLYRVVEKDGKLLRSENLGLDKREYSWQTYYAEGMEETRLVLTASKENFIDGDFSSFEPAVSFPNSYGYALNKNMFFKFLPLDLAASSTATDSKLIGKWAKSSGGPPQYNNGILVNLVNSGYHKGQYDFRADGTYSFRGESQFSSNDFAITEEKGKYTVSSNSLTVLPETSTVKKVDLNGTFKKLDQLPLLKRTYSWQLHFFEGINQTQLVLSGVKENMLDGGYGGNSSFPASFLYSQQYIPEWRFR